MKAKKDIIFKQIKDANRKVTLFFLKTSVELINKRNNENYPMQSSLNDAKERKM